MEVSEEVAVPTGVDVPTVDRVTVRVEVMVRVDSGDRVPVRVEVVVCVDRVVIVVSEVPLSDRVEVADGVIVMLAFAEPDDVRVPLTVVDTLPDNVLVRELVMVLV